MAESPIGEHGLADVADAGAFLARLVRLDPVAVVRLKRAGRPGRVELWARLPWGVLVSRTVAGPGPAPGDVTVSAAELLAEVARGGSASPPRRDAAWRWPLPGQGGRTVETVPADALRRISAAAEATVRTAAEQGVAGRAVGQRALRDALLDHVAIVVPPEAAGGRPVEVPQRLVQAVLRMGFLGAARDADPAGTRSPERTGSTVVPSPQRAAGPADQVQIRVVGRWTGLFAPYGSAWLLASSQLAIQPMTIQPFG